VTVRSPHAGIARGLLVGLALSTPVAGQRTAAPAVTFSADIAPIIFERCATCHRPEGAAPFSLLTYTAAKQRASLMARATSARLMPPWKSEPGYGHFDRAVASRDQALALNPAAPLAGAIRQRRALYGQHRAYVSR